jgi:hypothetical protein
MNSREPVTRLEISTVQPIPLHERIAGRGISSAVLSEPEGLPLNHRGRRIELKPGGRH